MTVEKAYNSWAAQYDTNKNRTRDLEAAALRAVLADIPFSTCLEIGCGTGKNTVWLHQKAAHLTAVDFSVEMLNQAKMKVSADNVTFVQADISRPWQFARQVYDLVTFSLVLEHISQLDFVFEQTTAALQPGGYVYIGELHPFKQYTGTKARFDTAQGRQEVECYTHHISEFIHMAGLHRLKLLHLNEFFDDDDKTTIPRILTLLLQKE